MRDKRNPSVRIQQIRVHIVLFLKFEAVLLRIHQNSKHLRVRDIWVRMGLRPKINLIQLTQIPSTESKDSNLKNSDQQKVINKNNLK